jgi:hypothetical protein
MTGSAVFRRRREHASGLDRQPQRDLGSRPQDRRLRPPPRRCSHQPRVDRRVTAVPARLLESPRGAGDRRGHRQSDARAAPRPRQPTRRLALRTRSRQEAAAGLEPRPARCVRPRFDAVDAWFGRAASGLVVSGSSVIGSAPISTGSCGRLAGGALVALRPLFDVLCSFRGVSRRWRTSSGRVLCGRRR